MLVSFILLCNVTVIIELYYILKKKTKRVQNLERHVNQWLKLTTNLNHFLKPKNKKII